jgi:hypothetical protein
MELEFDIESFEVGDEFVGNTKELRSFIRSVLEVGGIVRTVSHNTARILDLPKVEAPKKSQSPVSKLTKEVESDGAHQLRIPSPWSDSSSSSLRSADGSNPSNS